MNANLIKKGITLIGMSGAGKSSIGRLLAQHLGFYFLDLDEYIKEKEKMSHFEIMEKRGENELLRLEEKYALELAYENTIFSPSGSIVYSSKAVSAIKDNTTVVYLNISYDYLVKRLENNICARGIIGLKDRGLKNVFFEREPLYANAAHHVVFCDNKKPDEITSEILKILRQGSSKNSKIKYQSLK